MVSSTASDAKGLRSTSWLRKASQVWADGRSVRTRVWMDTQQTRRAAVYS